MNRKKVQGQMKNPFPESEGPGEHDPVHPAQGALVEKRQEGAGAGEDEHEMVQVVGKKMGPGIFIDGPVF